jgi:hypothetical protein
MKLHIRRHQKETGEQEKPILFHLSCRVELTPEEKHLVSRHNLDMSLSRSLLEVGSRKLYKPDLARFIEGIQYEHTNMGIVSAMEEEIIQSCKYFKAHLDSLVAFTGEETIEF